MTIVASDYSITKIDTVEERRIDAGTYANMDSIFTTSVLANSLKPKDSVLSDKYANSKLNQMGIINTDNPKLSRPDAVSKIVYPKDMDATNKALMRAWSGRALILFENISVNKREIVRMTERYLLALNRFPDERLLLASVLNIIRFNPGIIQDDAVYISRQLARIDMKQINQNNTLIFIRQIRARGFNASSVAG